MGEAVLRQAGDVAGPRRRMLPVARREGAGETLKKVLLPAPFGPMIEVSLPEKKSTRDVAAAR